MKQQTLTVTEEQRRELCQARVTLNGEPAVIGGVRNDFATVRQTATGLSAEWAWPTVARIVAKGGAFTTLLPGRGADRTSALVMNPLNLDASANRRQRLLAAFDALSDDARADFLETVEQITFNAGEHLPERRETREVFRQLYAVAGWE